MYRRISAIDHWCSLCLVLEPSSGFNVLRTGLIVNLDVIGHRNNSSRLWCNSAFRLSAHSAQLQDVLSHPFLTEISKGRNFIVPSSRPLLKSSVSPVNPYVHHTARPHIPPVSHHLCSSLHPPLSHPSPLDLLQPHFQRPLEPQPPRRLIEPIPRPRFVQA